MDRRWDSDSKYDIFQHKEDVQGVRERSRMEMTRFKLEFIISYDKKKTAKMVKNKSEKRNS